MVWRRVMTYECLYVHTYIYVFNTYTDSNFVSTYSVLKTFIHDPLVEWEKVKGRQTSAEVTNEKVCYAHIFSPYNGFNGTIQRFCACMRNSVIIAITFAVYSTAKQQNTHSSLLCVIESWIVKRRVPGHDKLMVWVLKFPVEDRADELHKTVLLPLFCALDYWVMLDN